MKTLKSIFVLGAFILMLTSVNVANAKTNAATASLTIVEIAVANEDFSILVEAIVKADLVDALSAPGPYTVFAPTNDAFNDLFASLGVNGIDDLTKEQLQPILLYHVVSGEVLAKDVTSGTITTLNKDATLDVKVKNGKVKINKSSDVIKTDIQGTNGVIHVIDAVLIPVEKPKSKMTSSSGGC
jgi:transforming growth factor-beta-induced protein